MDVKVHSAFRLALFPLGGLTLEAELRSLPLLEFLKYSITGTVDDLKGLREGYLRVFAPGATGQ
jgi:hypothetical protein